jgi:hypothetical protein
MKRLASTSSEQARELPNKCSHLRDLLKRPQIAPKIIATLYESFGSAGTVDAGLYKVFLAE